MMAEKTSLREYQRELAERMRGAERGRAASKLGVQVGDETWLVDLADIAEVVPVPVIAPVSGSETPFSLSKRAQSSARRNWPGA